MKKTRRSGKQVIALATTCAVLLLTFAGFLVYARTIEKYKKQILEEKSAQASEYVKESERITQEIEGLKVQIKRIERTGTQMSMSVFAQCTDNLYKDIFGISKNYKSAGTFVVTNDETVGAEGCITLAQYDEMLAAGWTPAVRAPLVKMDHREYLRAIKVHFEGLDREMPRAYYFPEGTFTKENLAMAIEEGFDTFFYRMEEPYAREINTEMKEAGDPVYIPYVFMSVNQKVFEKFDSIMSGGGCCALATRYAVSINGFNPGTENDPEYDSFIESVKDVYDTITAEYGYDRTVVEYRDETYAANVECVLQKNRLQEKIAELMRRRDELNAKIAEIYGSDLND